MDFHVHLTPANYTGSKFPGLRASQNVITAREEAKAEVRFVHIDVTKLSRWTKRWTKLFWVVLFDRWDETKLSRWTAKSFNWANAQNNFEMGL